MISVIIPVYNTEKYLRKCIDSVKNQTYKDLEILLIDDGSTDSSALICDEYAEKDERIQVWHRKNRGVSDSRNYGLSKSHGEWISFIDSDDWIDLDMYRILISLAERTESSTVCCGAYQGDNRETTKRNIWRQFEGNEIIYKDKEALAEVIRQSGTLWNKLLNGDCARKILFRTDIRYAEDTLYLAEYLEKNQTVAVTKKCLYYYRINREGNVVSSGLNTRHLDYVRATGMLFELLQKNELTEVGIERVIDVIVRVMALIRNPRLESQYIKATKDLAKRIFPYRKKLFYKKNIVKQIVKYFIVITSVFWTRGAVWLSQKVICMK